MRGPPSTGKSVMLNLFWYVAFFELGMNVICHKAGSYIHLYRPGSDTVERVDPDSVSDLLTNWNVVYLFNPSDGEVQPFFDETHKATSIIATSPNAKHYANILPHADHLPKDLSIIPMWSYAWTDEEIAAGFPVLDAKVSPEVEKEFSAVKGN